MPTTVLHATDFSEASGWAFDEALKLSRLTGAKLVVAHVLHFPPMLLDLPAQTDETEDAMRRWCGHRLKELAAKAPCTVAVVRPPRAFQQGARPAEA